MLPGQDFEDLRLTHFQMKIQARKSFWDSGAKQLNFEGINRRLTAKEAALLPSIDGSRMLVRDFIHNSLYHPIYGYFSKNATVFSPPKPYDFSKIKNNSEFMSIYTQQYQNTTAQEQIWHTPTELLQPHYGHAVARYIVEQFKLKNSLYLDIYEVGAGNGTLCQNILDYLREHEPIIYKKCRYNIIEISLRLSVIQRNKLKSHAKVQVINKSIFEWDTLIKNDCFIIGLEVLVCNINEDNLAHDMIRYDTETMEPVQGVVLTNEIGEFEQVYEQLSDDLIVEYLEKREMTEYKPPLFKWNFKHLLDHFNPYKSNLTGPEFLPTNAYQLIKILNTYFPRHQLIFSDFHHLPETIAGIDAPVVQSLYKGTMIPCQTFLVKPGLFDIFFPTNFELLRDIYGVISGKESTIHSNRSFLQRYGDVKATTTKSGENPMLDYYENASFITTKL